ncbi:MAG: symmetrical bis(5'-nucleosyl)-tetraphosphatase [Betaproteobacteria bacterium]|nr:symmetrical bis(5'-nucleosyl)-tetraphosphatase [Betaproteobacteria bacterium]
MSTYAIGDIQGCYEEFRQLLLLLDFSPSRDRLWLVGDLVNRGPGSLETLRYVQSLDDAATTVLGNHDLHLLTVAAGHARLHRRDTLRSILDAPDRAALLQWLRTRPLIHVDGAFVLVHAGLIPPWTVPQALDLAGEVAAALAGPKHDQFLRVLYGNTPDWTEQLTGWDRLRAIVNVCTRLRFCARDGRLEFDEKRGAEHAPVGFAPWFKIPERRSATHTLICGHWSTLELRLEARVWMLDSGCLWGGPLSAVRLEDGAVFQVPSRQPLDPKPR